MSNNNKEVKGQELKSGFNAASIQKEQAKKGAKIKMRDRVKLEVTVDTNFYKKGQIISPHKIYAEKMIADGTAKKLQE